MTISDFRLRQAFVQDTLLHFLTSNKEQLSRLPFKNISLSKIFYLFWDPNWNGRLCFSFVLMQLKFFFSMKASLLWQGKQGTVPRSQKPLSIVRTTERLWSKFWLLVPAPCYHPLRDYWNSTAQSQQRGFIQKGRFIYGVVRPKLKSESQKFSPCRNEHR